MKSDVKNSGGGGQIAFLWVVLGEVRDFIIDCTSYYLDVHHMYTTQLCSFTFQEGGGAWPS